MQKKEKKIQNMTWINKNTKNTSRAPQAVPNNRRNPQIFHLNYNFVFFIYLKRQNYEIATLTLNKKKKERTPRPDTVSLSDVSHSLTHSLSFFLSFANPNSIHHTIPYPSDLFISIQIYNLQFCSCQILILGKFR